jgi:hypothetical protein
VEVAGGAGESTSIAGAGADGGVSSGGAASAEGDAGDPSVGGDTGAGGAGEEGGSAGALCEERVLGRAVVEHACLHVEHGPFEELAAGTVEESAPALGAPHTVYRVTASAGAQSWLRFTATSAGSYAFMGVMPPSVRFLLADGSLAAAEPRNTTCPGLPTARVFDLDAASPLSMSWLEGELVLVVEALASFGDLAWESGCECRGNGRACMADADCCTLYCAEGFCESAEAPPCGGKAAEGEPCVSSEGCCSGHCADAYCAAPVCRSSGPCVSDDECCLFCHDQDHCH